MYGMGLSATFNLVSLCLWEQEKYLGSLEFPSHGMHTILLSKIEELLGQYQKTFLDISFVVVDTGPASSFTGLRLSLAMIKSWAMLQHLTIYQTRSTLLLYEEWQALYPEELEKKVLVGYFGFQKRVYTELFAGGESLGDVSDMPIEELQGFLEHSQSNIVVMGTVLQHLDFKLQKYVQTVPIYVPHIHFSRMRKQILWRDLSPHYYRKTQAEEGI